MKESIIGRILRFGEICLLLVFLAVIIFPVMMLLFLAELLSGKNYEDYYEDYDPEWLKSHKKD
jgi:hypothetical protein